MTLDRRQLLLKSALGCAAFSLPWRRALAAPTDDNVLVTIFLRGAADGLNLVVPVDERATYERLRPTIALKDSELLAGTKRFSFHPGLKPLLPLFKQGQLAAVHGVGSPHGTRSHFKAMDYMERAAPGQSTGPGWLNKTLVALGATKVTEGIALGGTQASMTGKARVLTAPGLDEIQRTVRFEAERAKALRDMHSIGARLDRVVRGGLTARDRLGRLDRTTAVVYPGGPLGTGLKDAAALIKGSTGVRVMALDMGGWDTHTDESARLAGQAAGLAGSLAAFWKDLGATHRRRTTVLVMTEFGRTAAENGSGGTDHGHGSVMFALGHNVRGGAVRGAFPGIAKDKLYMGRDLAVTTDFRDVFSEVLDRHMGLSPAKQGAIFPKRTPSRSRYVGLF